MDTNIVLPEVLSVIRRASKRQKVGLRKVLPSMQPSIQFGNFPPTNETNAMDIENHFQHLYQL